MRTLRWAVVFWVAGTTACGNGGGGTGTLRLAVTAINPGNGASKGALALDPGASSTTTFVNGSIASGPPDSLGIAVRKIELRADRAGIPIFDEPAGKSIQISGSRVDLSDLFTHYDCVDGSGDAYQLKTGETCDCGFDDQNHVIATAKKDGKDVCPWDAGQNVPRGHGGRIASIEAGAGSYTSLAVTFKRKARAQGCVTGNFGAPGSTVTGVHTYCTRAAGAFMAGMGGAPRGDFEGGAAQESDFDLARPGGEPPGGDELTVEFPIQGGLTLAPGGAAPLTLVIDTSRLLRFYNQATDNPINPGAPTSVSYFFTTVFQDSIYLFGGRAGTIFGYQLTTNACFNVEDASVPPDYQCTMGGQVVAAWLTLVTGPSGAPLTASLMPDDDNTLTVLKGNNQAMRAGHAAWDSSMIVSRPDGRLDVSYRLGPDEGTIFNIDTHAAPGASLPDVHFRGLQKSFGVVTASRGL
jgi:hypothetical protein